jgi:hypothetical protein
MVKTILNYIGKTGPAGYYGPGGVLVGAVHEWLEMLGDIWCNGWSVNWDTGQVVAQEHCDPVENSDYAVTVPSHLGIATNVYVSNFVLPQWFNNGGPGPYDHLGHLSKPFQLERGGYCVVADISNESQVTQRTIKGVRQPFGVQVLGDVPTTHGYRTMRRFGLTSAEEAALRELAA